MWICLHCSWKHFLRKPQCFCRIISFLNLIYSRKIHKCKWFEVLYIVIFFSFAHISMTDNVSRGTKLEGEQPQYSHRPLNIENKSNRCVYILESEICKNISSTVGNNGRSGKVCPAVVEIFRFFITTCIFLSCKIYFTCLYVIHGSKLFLCS
jgi:hypothetical protein